MHELYPHITGAFVELQDGKRGYLARPDGPGPFPAVLVFMEAFGVNDYLQSEVRRLAQHGYVAAAPDFYDGELIPYSERPKMVAKLGSLSDAQLLPYVRAAIDRLDRDPGVRHDGYAAIGFCLGGRIAFLTAAEFPNKIVAASSWYGGNIGPEEQKFFVPLLDRVPEITATVQMVYGAEDEGITPREHARVAEALSAAKKRFSLTVYPGAPHGFASRDRDAYRPQQAEHAWKQALALFDETFGRSVAVGANR